MDLLATEDFPVFQQEVLVEFRAGKMTLEGKTVVPDGRKGLVRIVRGEEGLVHFQWLDRTRNAIEDDQIIFPDEAVFKKVNQASGRVYILKFSTDDRKFFFWMQEPKSEDDSQFCSSVNYYINRPLDEEEPESSAHLQVSEDILEPVLAKPREASQLRAELARVESEFQVLRAKHAETEQELLAMHQATADFKARVYDKAKADMELAVALLERKKASYAREQRSLEMASDLIDEAITCFSSEFEVSQSGGTDDDEA